jgi:hypothetical protein
MFFGYYVCKSDESCTAPFIRGFESLSQEDVQSRLPGLALGRRRNVPDSIVRPSIGFVGEEKDEGEDEEYEGLFVDRIPFDYNNPGVLVIPVGGDIDSGTLKIIQAVSYLFDDALSRIEDPLYIYVHVGGVDPLRRGYRANVTDSGNVMNIVSQDNYSLRYIKDSEYRDLLFHEYGHMFQYNLLNSQERREWDNLVLDRGRVNPDAASSKYSIDEFEILAELVVAAVHNSAEEIKSVNETLDEAFDFLGKFGISNLDRKRTNKNFTKDNDDNTKYYPGPSYQYDV